MESHYNERYFFAERAGGVKYKVGEEEREFGYKGGGIWNFEKFLNKLRELLGTPDSLLDIGAGCGGLVATCNAMGIEALGLEFSEFAVSNPVLGAGPYLKRWDVENIPWCNPDPREYSKPMLDSGGYDFVTAIDLFEHLFEDEVDSVIAETKRVAGSHIIAKICTAQLPREVWVAKRGTVEEVRKQAIEEGFEWLWASGHVNSQFPEYWKEKFVDDDWRLLESHSERLVGDLKLPPDWRTTLILERIYQGPIEPMPSEFYESYYDEDYFRTPRGKKYRDPDGIVHGWSYSNPDGEFTGAAEIAQGWKEVFNPKDMLDVGAGRGTFTAYARDVGIQAIGFDYSEFAVGEGRYPRCKPEWLIRHDATMRWPWGAEQFELTVVLDFLEHVYTDVPFLPSDIRNLIYLRCYQCTNREMRVCPLKSAVGFGERDKSVQEKTQNIEKNKMNSQENGERNKRRLIQKGSRNDREPPEDARMKNSKKTPSAMRRKKSKLGRGCEGGEKSIGKKLDESIKEHIINVRSASKNTQKNIKSFLRSTELLIIERTRENGMSLSSSKEASVRFVDIQIQELLKSIMLMGEETEQIIGAAQKTGVNCNSCVPTVIGLCTSDLDKVIGEMFRVAERFIFLQIATSGDSMADGSPTPHYALKKGEPVPEELGEYVVAGHVTVMPEEWWYDRLDHEDWMPRRDMVQHFCGVVDNDIIVNWLANSIIILERV